MSYLLAAITHPNHSGSLTLCIILFNLMIASAISLMSQGRTALLLRCSVEEARQIRDGANMERRSVSGYVLNVLDRALRTEELMFARLQHGPDLNRTLSRMPRLVPGPRTVIFVRCSVYEASRIRDAARRRNTTISGFVLHSLRRTWNVAHNPPGIRSRAPL